MTSFQASIDEGVRNAGRLIKEGGAHAVKIEGPQLDLIHRLVDIGIPVMAHIGLTPQSVYGLGGYKVQGRGEAAQRMFDQAAIDAVKRWRFEPVKRDGAAVAQRAAVRIRFEVK